MKIRYLLFALLIFMFTNIEAQERYLDQVFDDVEVVSNVPYGMNFTVQALTVTGHSEPQPLVMDFYQPTGDTVQNRPLVIVLHTGNFLPIQVNGSVTGTKTDSATVEVCKRLARMGYVAASADYRTGWNPFADGASNRTLGLINAAYRGLQDARTCIRFFKRDKSELGDNYGVDTSRIVVWGMGTGGYIAQAVATLDEYTEILTTTTPPGKFTTDLNGDMTPDPMIVELFNGDIYGTSLGLSPGGAIPAGDTLCLPNHVGYSSDFQLCVNMGGALGDISWLEAGEVPFIAYHVPLDENAPYESEILLVPSPVGALPVVEVQGSKTAIEAANAVGNNDVFAEVDDETTDAAKLASAAAGHDYLNGLYPFNQALNMFNRIDGAPWTWWEPAHWDTIPHPTAGIGAVPAGATFHDVASFSDPDMSPENARAYIDTIMAYYAPRAYLALGLSDTTSTSVDLLTKAEVELVLSPNPSPGLLQIASGPDNPMLSVRILDVTGRLILDQTKINSHKTEINHGHVTPGLYLVEIMFDKGRVVEQVVFR